MIIVTGAAGFIGKHVSSRLSGIGHDVLGVDTKPLLPPVYSEFMHKDVLLAWFRGMSHALSPGDVDAVIHMGAVTDTTCDDWDALNSNNIRYSESLLDWCAMHNRPFIYASSAATYGNGSSGFSDDTSVLGLKPLNAYGWSKLLLDTTCLRLEREGRTPSAWAGLRFFNVYGNGEAHKGKMASMVHQGLEQAKRYGKIRLFRNGAQRRDFIHVDDVADIILFMLDAKPHGIYNVGTGQARSFNVMAAAIFGILGQKPDIEYFDMPAHIAAAYQTHTCADISKLRTLGYDGELATLEGGVRKMTT
jgi:ADP-L-glycero-D-manno-heptose 6-epimerase